jgi:hypothetical protein
MLKGLNRKVAFKSENGKSTFKLVGEDGEYVVTVPGIPENYTLRKLATHVEDTEVSVKVTVKMEDSDCPSRSYSSKEENGDTFQPFLAKVADAIGEERPPARRAKDKDDTATARGSLNGVGTQS